MSPRPHYGRVHHLGGHHPGGHHLGGHHRRGRPPEAPRGPRSAVAPFPL